MESSFGLTVLNIRETMSKTRRKDGDFLFGPTEDNMKVNGSEVSSQVQASLQLQTENQSLGCGSKENDKNGFEKKNGRR